MRLGLLYATGRDATRVRRLLRRMRVENGMEEACRTEDVALSGPPPKERGCWVESRQEGDDEIFPKASEIKLTENAGEKWSRDRPTSYPVQYPNWDGGRNEDIYTAAFDVSVAWPSAAFNLCNIFQQCCWT